MNTWKDKVFVRKCEARKLICIKALFRAEQTYIFFPMQCDSKKYSKKKQIK